MSCWLNFLLVYGCLIFSVRSWKCREMKPIRDCLNWKKVKIFLFSFLVPVCPDLATFKEGRVHHRGKAPFILIFRRECFNASVNQTNVKWPIFLLVFPASNQLLKEINVLEIQFQIERSCRESAESLAVKVCCVFSFLSFLFLPFPFLPFLT